MDGLQPVESIVQPKSKGNCLLKQSIFAGKMCDEGSDWALTHRTDYSVSIEQC